MLATKDTVVHSLKKRSFPTQKRFQINNDEEVSVEKKTIEDEVAEISNSFFKEENAERKFSQQSKAIMN